MKITKLPCCTVNGVCRHKDVRVQRGDHLFAYEKPHKPGLAGLTQCDFTFCDTHWNVRLKVLESATAKWQEIVSTRPPKLYGWSYNRLHGMNGGDGSTWVPRWGTKYAAELIQLLDCVEGSRRQGAPRKGRMFSRDGTTATNLRKGGYIRKVKGGFVLTKKGRKYIKTQGDM